MRIYSIQDADLSNVRVKILNGDMKEVFPVGFDFHPVTKSARQPDGTRISKSELNQGVRVHPEGLPTRMARGGSKPMQSDIGIMHSLFFVSDKFRGVVETLEPKSHQFEPVDLILKDGTVSATYYWLYPCARIDCFDRDQTTHTLHDTGLWMDAPGGHYVANLSAIDGRHMWIDPRMTAGTWVFVSEAFKQAMYEAGVRGIGYHELPAV